MPAKLYSAIELDGIPSAATLASLGCGNPVAVAELREGETVLDLGSGGGFDCFLAAAETGESGHVIGIDMTPTMISKARGNAVKGQYGHVEFRLGEIEHMPVANDMVDVIISNCVINLSPDKRKTFHEVMRVLKPGGRLVVSDIVTDDPIPTAIKNDEQFRGECLGGAMLQEDLVVVTHIPAGNILMHLVGKNHTVEQNLNHGGSFMLCSGFKNLPHHFGIAVHCTCKKRTLCTHGKLTRIKGIFNGSFRRSLGNTSFGSGG